MQLKGKKIIQLIENDFEDLELWYPVLYLRGEGADVTMAGPEPHKTYHGKYGVPAQSEVDFESIDPAGYDGILVPGGWAPDKLRRYPKVIDMVRHMEQHKKVIGQICHAGWVLISADVLRGKNVTSTPGIKDDMTNAGASWHDEPVVTDGHLISSRRPPDLPDYMKAFTKALGLQETK
jgi:protease I